MTPYDRRENEEHKPGPVITDKRHSREVDETAEASVPEPAPEPPAAPQPPAEPEPPAQPEGVVEFTRPAPAEAPAVEAAAPPAADEPPAGPQTEEEAYATAEMEHLKMLFGAGIVNYLRSQLGLLLNFAVIGLGRAPNPATGLVSTELEKAKLAIDVLEFIAARLKGQLPAQEEQEIAQILAELKYSFLQLASNAAKPPADGEE